MEIAQPIKDEVLIRKIKEYLKDSPREYMLFTVGINLGGLRVSDLIRIKKSDVVGPGVTHLKIRHQKTGKTKFLFINAELAKELESYTKNMSKDDYLFSSKTQPQRHISRFMVHRILKKIAKEFHLQSFSANALKKTFGWSLYSKTKDIALLQTIFAHSSQSITLRYLSITQDVEDQALKNFYL